MTLTEMRAALVAPLLEAGFVKAGRCWTASTDEVLWVVEPEQARGRGVLRVDIGATTDPALVPRHATDCPLLLHIENLPGFERLDVIETFDLESRVGEDERLARVEEIGRELTSFLRERSDFAALRRSFHSGDFQAGFVHRELRARFES